MNIQRRLQKTKSFAKKLLYAHLESLDLESVYLRNSLTFGKFSCGNLSEIEVSSLIPLISTVAMDILCSSHQGFGEASLLTRTTKNFSPELISSDRNKIHNK